MNKAEFLLKANSYTKYMNIDDFVNQIKSGNIGLYINQSLNVKQEGYDAIVTIQCNDLHKTFKDYTSEIGDEILKQVKYWLLTSGHFTDKSLTIKVKYAKR